VGTFLEQRHVRVRTAGRIVIDWDAEVPDEDEAAVIDVVKNNPWLLMKRLIVAATAPPRPRSGARAAVDRLVEKSILQHGQLRRLEGGIVRTRVVYGLGMRAEEP
jgi:hypothetical protein